MPQDMKTRYGHTESWNHGVTELRTKGAPFVYEVETSY